MSENFERTAYKVRGIPFLKLHLQGHVSAESPRSRPLNTAVGAFRMFYWYFTVQRDRPHCVEHT